MLAPDVGPDLWGLEELSPKEVIFKQRPEEGASGRTWSSGGARDSPESGR